MSENIDFRVDYNKFKVMDEFNTDELKYPLILSIPHCGTVFPEEFLRAVRHDVMTLRKNEDILVYDLLEPAIRDGGIAAIKLNVSRSFIDVNRAKVELDPNMFFDYPREDIGLNQQRSRYGLGIIHKVTADSRPIYAGRISYKEAEERFFVENELAKREYYVAKNRPYSGAYITFNYCEPRKQAHTLQLEINRVIYADENTLEKNSNFQRVSYDLSKVVTNLANFLLDF